jgi:predicted metal-dependent HD superfamily phosphohydrolase
MSDELEQSFVALWLKVGSNDPAKAEHVRESVFAHYSDPARHYHTLGHVKHCLDQARLVADRLPNADAINLAIWFHDVVYTPAAGDNEVRSAALFRDLADAVMPSRLADDVNRLILMTRYAEIPRDDDEMYMVDIDYSSFGRPWEIFLTDSRAVRAERPDLSDAEFVAQQSRFLESLLDRAALYRTEFFRSRYERKARSNIGRYLEMMGSQDGRR